MLAAKLLGGFGEEKLYVDDVFSAYTYTGNGSTQTITNGIDLAGKGGMVWVKSRSNVVPHYLQDSARSNFGQSLQSQATDSQFATTYITSVTSAGYSVSGNANLSGQSAVAWTFRKAPKFFDVVTYTGNGTTQNVAHSLGVAPGLILVKRTDNTSDWFVYHRSQTKTNVAYLNQTAAFTGGGVNCWGNNSTTVEPTDSVFTVGSLTSLNANATPYVAYLFAHDTSADGLIQCGTYTGTAPISVTLGWEPQFLLVKESTGLGGWEIMDSSRGFPASSNQQVLETNTSGAEFSGTYAQPTATGFKSTTTATFIYMAIRRPNKPPTLGTQVYNAIARTGTGAAATVTGVGFAPDLVHYFTRTSGYAGRFVDRLRGNTQTLQPSSTGAEGATTTEVTAFAPDGIAVGTHPSININAASIINHFFKRAVGVMDVVCYTGTGVAKTEAHGLGVVPELIIVKARNSVDNWPVNIGTTTGFLELNTTQQSGTAASYWNSTVPTSSVFSLGNSSVTNGNTVTYVAYLFATKPGISKCFSFTGDGTAGKVINCGFTTGARFILIKRTDSTGDWFVYDSTRGYPAGNDGHLSLNTTAAEVITTDDVDYEATGFIVNQNATTNLNVTSATYIGLAYA